MNEDLSQWQQREGASRQAPSLNIVNAYTDVLQCQHWPALDGGWLQGDKCRVVVPINCGIVPPLGQMRGPDPALISLSPSTKLGVS